MTPAHDTPAAEVSVDAELVHGLLRDQVPHLAHRELIEVAAGWDNVIFRLGAEHSVRLPRRAAAAKLIEHEQRWLPALAARLPLPIPAPVAVGQPGRGYPWSWSVLPWLPGVTALTASPDDLHVTAVTLGEFLVALHRPAPDDAPPNPFRGVLLADRAERLHAQVEQMRTEIDARAVLTCWEELLGTSPWPGPPMWIHGDLHRANLLVDRGRLSAVIDFGDVTSGDPATDLSVAWMMFAAAERAVLRGVVGADDDTWARARGWALALGVAYVASSADDPLLAREGHRLIDAALTDR